MGNCCDCLRGSSEEQEYTPIETTEITQPRSGGRSGVVGEKNGISNYQSIIDRASSDFISSKYRAKSDALAISGNQEAVGLVRSKLNQAELSPDVAVSPPNTGLNIDALMRLKLGGGKERGNSHAQDADVNGNNSVVNSKRNTEPQSVISLLHVEPVVKTQNYANMEGTANDIALIMTQKVFDKDVDTHNATMAESAGSGVGTGSSSTSSSSSSSSGSSSGSSSTGTGAGLSHRLAHMSSLLAVFIGACWCLSGLIKCAHHHHHQQQLQLPVLQQPFLPAAAAAAAATASASYSKTDVSYPSAVTPSSDGIIHSTVRQKMRLSPPAVNSRSSTSTSISDSNAVGYRSGTVGEERGHAWIEFNNNTDINYDNNDGTSTGIDAEIAAESDAFDSLNDGTGINTFMSAASYSSRATVMRAGHPPPPPPPPPHHHHNSALVILATLLLCGVSVVAVIAVVLAAIYSEFGNDSRNGHMVIVSNGNTDGSAQTYEYSCISRLWKSAINRASLGSKLTKVHTV